MSFEQGLDNLSLDTDAAAMDDPDLPKPPLNSLIQVFLYNNGDFPRLASVCSDRLSILCWNDTPKLSVSTMPPTGAQHT